LGLVESRGFIERVGRSRERGKERKGKEGEGKEREIDWREICHSSERGGFIKSISSLMTCNN
jgi:hypothetical protein